MVGQSIQVIFRWKKIKKIELLELKEPMLLKLKRSLKNKKINGKQNISSTIFFLSECVLKQKKKFKSSTLKIQNDLNTKNIHARAGKKSEISCIVA